VRNGVHILNLKWRRAGEPLAEPRLTDIQTQRKLRLREFPPSHQFLHVDLQQLIRGLRPL
jgi:hypothetical protein